MKTNPQLSTDQRLVTLRIIWFAMLMGEVIFLLIVLMLIQTRPGTPADPDVTRLLLYIGIGLVVTAVPMGYLIRSRIYEMGRQTDGTVDPARYVTGNIVLLAMCEGPAFLGLVNILLSRQIMPSLMIVIIAMAVQAINFPTGGPLRRL